MKASNGSPCSDSSSRKNTGRCVHAGIVAVYIHDQHNPGVGGEELELERDGDMDGVEFGPEGGEWGVEGAIGGATEFASCTQREDPLTFGEKMGQLRVITSVYKFPVVEPELKPETYGRKRISVNACACTGCGLQHRELPDGEAILLGQVGD